MKIGIPKALYYYHFFDEWKYFFEYLNISVVTSQDTNKEIINNGSFYSSDEMCLSLKIFLGHIVDIKNKCDYVLIPIIYNYGLKDQMCCNYLALYDLVNNIFDLKILTYKIDYFNNQKEIDGLIEIGKQLGIKKSKIKEAYKYANNECNRIQKRLILENKQKLTATNKKVLLVSHSYNMYDNYISKDVINFLEKSDCTIIYCDRFENKVTNELSRYLSRDLYWKYAKENIGSIILTNDQIDGIVFLTTFPCGLDSLVNELVMRKITKPYLNIIIDDLDSNTGIETRLESFIDIIGQN